VRFLLTIGTGSSIMWFIECGERHHVFDKDATTLV